MSRVLPDASPFAVVLITAPKPAVARRLARTILDERLAACVNVVPGVRSLYRWEGKICEDAEVLCIVKTRHALLDRLIERVRGLHPYSVPEVIVLPLVAGSAPYLAWMAAATRPGPDRRPDRRPTNASDRGRRAGRRRRR
ncbi:MAG: divalent-cation tolerance protein CutA [Planctomycetes bacterium]|nr:divalent-cation tolerance protein CutA [Planctomycetota bacterium]